MGERVVADDPQRHPGAVDLRPDQGGQFQHGGGFGGGQVEVLVQRAGVLQGGGDAAGQVAAIGVVADLGAVAQDVQRVLALEDFLDQVGDHVAHGQPHVPGHDLLVPAAPALPDADAVERPHDRVRQPVLLIGGAGEVLHGQLLETVDDRGGGT